MSRLQPDVNLLDTAFGQMVLRNLMRHKRHEEGMRRQYPNGEYERMIKRGGFTDAQWKARQEVSR